jgi:CHAD domain-containing protein
MAYAFERDESAHAAVMRVMAEQIGRARAQLTDSKLPPGKRVHEARKRFKETRALVRLVRKPLGAQFAIENAAFRDFGRDLAAARDAEAVTESLEKLATQASIRPAAIKKARRTLAARRDTIDAADLDARVAKVVVDLDTAESRLATWPALGESFEDAIGQDLLRTYAAGRKEMKVALRAGDATSLHEWRKRVKEHWYHTQLLRAMWPAMLKPYAAVLEDLARALGDHHDLFVLRGLVVAEASRSRDSLRDAIDARQRELEGVAAGIGRRVYAETPDAFLARMRKYWNAWRAP